MKGLAEMTVGEATVHSPASARVFEAYGIDFCCAGQIPITEACLARGLDPDEVVRALEQAAQSAEAGPVDWKTAPAGDLIDHIVERHHAYLKVQLPRIQALFEEAVTGRNHDDVVHALFICFRGMREVLEARLMQQETALFPALRDLERRPASAACARGAERDPVHLMMQGHDLTARALAEMRRMTNNYTPPAEARAEHQELYRALHELEADLHRHFHLENNILFQRAGGRVQDAVATTR